MLVKKISCEMGEIKIYVSNGSKTNLGVQCGKRKFRCQMGVKIL